MRIIAQTDNFGVNVKIKPVLDAKDFSNDLKTKIQELSKKNFADEIEAKVNIKITPNITNINELQKKINEAVRKGVTSVDIPVNTTSVSSRMSSKSLKVSGKISAVKAEKEDVKAVASEYQKLNSLLNEINSKKSTYMKLDVKKQTADVRELKNQIRSLSDEYSKLYLKNKESLSKTQKSDLFNLENKFVRDANIYRAAKVTEYPKEQERIAKQQAKLAEQQAKQREFYESQLGTTTKIGKDGKLFQKTDIQSYLDLERQLKYKDPKKNSTFYEKTRKEFAELERLSESCSNSIKSNASNEEIGRYWEPYSAQLKKTTQAYREASQAQREYVKQQNVVAGFEKRQSTLLNKSELYLMQNSALKTKAGDVYKELLLLQSKIKNLDPTIEGSGAKLTEYGRDFQQLQYRAKLAGAEVQTSFERLKETFRTRVRSIASATAFSALMGTVYSLKQNVTDIDSALTQLKIVTGATNTEIANYFDNASKYAEKYGNTIKDIIGSTETYSRLGFSLNDSLNLSNITNQFANVADISESDATTAMTSIIKAYDKDASDAELIADKLVEVGQKYAVSASELGVALENGGSALAVANTDLDESIALIAAGNASVQDASKVGNAVKTLSAYIRGSSADLKELGEDVDGTVESTSKLQDKVKALTGGKVSLLEDDGQTYRSIYDIMVDIANVWDSMSDVNKASLIEAIAGKRQANVVSSIITNINDLKGAYESSTNAAGTLSTATEKYLDSIEGKSAQLSAQWQELSYDLLNTEAIKKFVSAGTGLLKFLDNLVSKFGSLATIGIGAGLFKGLEFGKNALDRTKRSGTLLGEITTDLYSKYSKDAIFSKAGLLNSVNKATIINGESFTTQINSLKQVTASVEGLTKAEARRVLAMQGYNKAIQDQVVANMQHARSLKTVWASMSTFTKIGLIAGAIAAVIKGIDLIVDKVNDSTSDLLEKKETLNNNLSEISSELENIKNQINELKNKELKVTDESDIEALRKQVELLEQRKEILEKKKVNAVKENKNNAEDIIESTESKSAYSGAGYTNGVSGKLNKFQSLFYGSQIGLVKSADEYVETLVPETVHPDEIKSVIDNLNEIYDTYDKITQDDSLVGTDAYNIAIEKQKHINELLEKMIFLQSVRNDLDNEDNNILNTDKTKQGFDFQTYQNNLNELIEIGREKGSVTKNNVTSQFGNNIGLLEGNLKEQGLTLDDYVRWLNDAIIKQSDFANQTKDTSNSVADATKQITTFKDSFEKTATSSESVETLSKAYENFKNNGRFDFDDIESIQKNFSDVKGINKYIKQLSKAKKGTTEYKKVLSELTYQKIRSIMSDEEIIKSGKDVLTNMLQSKGVTNASAVADSLLIKAKANLAAKSFKIAESANVTKKALQVEAEAVGITKTQFALLIAQQIDFNNSSLSVNDKISSLQNLALAAGATSDAINGIGKGIISNPDGSISYIKNGVLHRGSKNSNIADGIIKEQTQKAIGSSKDKVKQDFKDIKVNFGGGSGKGSSGGSGGSGSKTDSKLEKFRDWISKLFDWIEVKIKRLQRKVELYQNRAERKINASNFGTNTGSSSKSTGAYKQYYKAQNSVADEIEAAQAGSKKYLSFSNKVLNKAKSSGLINKKQLKEIKSKVRNGTIDISSYNERMQEVIKEYQTYYEKYLDMSDSIEDLNKTLEDIAEAVYDIPKQKLDKAMEKIDRKNSVLSAKGSVAIGSANKNAVLSQSNTQAKLEAQAYKTYGAQASKNLALARKKIDSKNDAALKGLTNKQKAQIINAQRNGLEIDITQFKKLSKKGKSAITSYNAALKANATAADEAAQAQYNYIKTVRENMKEMFDNVKNEWDAVVGDKTFGLGLSDNSLSILQAKGRLLSGAMYEGQISLNQQKLADLQSEKSALLSRLNSIDVGSEEWIDANQTIQDVESSIWSTEAAIAQLEKTIRELDLSNFETLETRISNVADEASFLADIMSEEKMFDDDGKITKQGQATAGIYAEKYGIYMKQAEDYGKKVIEWNQRIANDPANADLISERDELLKKQQEAIKNAQSEKEAIKSLVEQGIKAELDAVKELISKYTDALDSQKELYEYQKKIAEQSSKVARIQKQIAAYSGDNSSEAKTKIQKLKLDLQNAQQELDESQYDKSILDQKEMLDKLYDDYEELLNKRLDNIDGLLTEVIGYVNANSSSISNTISQEANNVGYIISRENDDIWRGYNVGDIVSETDNNFSSVRMVLNGMESHLSSQIAASQQEENSYLSSIYNVLNELKTIVGGNKQNEPAKNPTNTKIKVDDNGYVPGNYIKVDKSTTLYPMEDQPNYTGDKNKLTIHKPSGTWDTWTIVDICPTGIIIEGGNGDRYWVDYNSNIGSNSWHWETDYGEYATGSPSIPSNQLAWTQENGQEAIVRNDGAILTPLVKGNMVLPAKATKNLWEFMNDYDNFSPMKTLGIVKKNVSATSIGDINMNIELPNVNSYDDFVRELKNDSSFENIVKSITANQLVGSSRYNKYKS